MTLKQKVSKLTLRIFSFFWIAFGLLTIAVIDYFSGVLMMMAGLLLMPSVLNTIKFQAPRIRSYMVVVLSILILLFSIASILKSMDYVESRDYLPFDENLIEVTEPRI